MTDKSDSFSLMLGITAIVFALIGMVLPESTPITSFSYNNLTDIPQTFPYGNLTGVPNQWNYVILSNNFTIPATGNYFNITGLVFTAQANTVYEIEVYVLCQFGSTSFRTLTLALNGITANFVSTIGNKPAGAFANSYDGSGYDSPVSITGAPSTNTLIYLHTLSAILSIGVNTGTVIIRGLNDVGQTNYFKAGSFIKYKIIG